MNSYFQAGKPNELFRNLPKQFIFGFVNGFANRNLAFSLVMNFEDFVTATTVIVSVLILVDAALVIWCVILALRVEFALRQLQRLMNPQRGRDGSGRPLRERL